MVLAGSQNGKIPMLEYVNILWETKREGEELPGKNEKITLEIKHLNWLMEMDFNSLKRKGKSAWA